MSNQIIDEVQKIKQEKEDEIEALKAKLKLVVDDTGKRIDRAEKELKEINKYKKVEPKK